MFCFYGAGQSSTNLRQLTFPEGLDRGAAAMERAAISLEALHFGTSQYSFGAKQWNFLREAAIKWGKIVGLRIFLWGV